MPGRIPHQDEYVRYFNGAIEGDFLKSVPVMADPTNPKLVIVSACGHASHNTNRYNHIWHRISPMTQQYSFNGGGVIYDPVYGQMNRRQRKYFETAYDQLEDFIKLSLDDGTIEFVLNRETDQIECVVPMYLVFDIPCKVITALNWTPEEFVASSIRAKTQLKEFHPHGVTFKVGLLYFLGEPIHSPGLTWYAPRCDMELYSNDYLGDRGKEPALTR